MLRWLSIILNELWTFQLGFLISRIFRDRQEDPQGMEFWPNRGKSPVPGALVGQESSFAGLAMIHNGAGVPINC